MSKQTFPPQTQQQRPGSEEQMRPLADHGEKTYRGVGKLRDKVAVITGGDSGIGRAIAVAFSREGADVAILYLNEHEDAEKTRHLVEEAGRRCLLFPGDIGDVQFCREVIGRIVQELGRLDIVVNNAAEQHPTEDLLGITPEQLERTFRTNIFGMFYLTQAALPHLAEDSTIINTTSVTAYRGSPHLIDYASTKGAIVAFTRSLSKNLASRKVRVNAVAPGPIWTPLIPSTFHKEKVETFGSDTPLERPGQPAEVAPAYVFLASRDSSYITGQVLHPNGGEIVNG